MSSPIGPKSPLLSADNAQNNGSKRSLQIKPSSYGETVKFETKIESICGIVYFILFLAMCVSYALGIAKKNKTDYKVSNAFVLSYQIMTVILCLYYCCRFEFVAIKNIIIYSKFWAQSFLSFLFNIISFILICVNIFDGWDIILSFTYLLGAVSLPLPAICIKLNHKYKYKQNKIILTPTTSVAAGLPMFSDIVLKFSLCCCYIGHLVHYIMNATPNFNSDMYTHKIMYSINEICLRPWMGMTLISVIFVLVAELTDKQLVSTNYNVLYQLYSDKIVCNCIGRGRRMVILILALLFVSIAFECIPPKSSKFATSSHRIINGAWILINIIFSVYLLNYICLFSGIYSKTRYKFQKSNNTSRPSPIKAFVMEGLCTLCMYLVYIICLFIEYYTFNIEWSWLAFDIYRQVAILILLSLQFITLIRLKQIQKFGRFYVERFNKYECALLVYYQPMCFLLMYNSLYILIFTVQFFSYDEKYKGFALTFSFSVMTAMLVMLSHFLYSYKKWKIDKNNYQNYDETEENSRKSMQILSENGNGKYDATRKQSGGTDLSSHEYESFVSK